MKKRIKLYILYAVSFIVSAAPLAVTFAINYSKYTETVAASVKLSIGGLIVLALLFLKAINRLEAPKGIAGPLIAFLLAYLLDAILHDLVLLLGMYLLGEAIDLICLRWYIKKLEEDIRIGKTADATAKQVEEVIKRYSGGRV